VNDSAYEIVELKRVRPVKWSAIDRKVQPFRLGYVKAFLEYEGRPVLEEDGQPVLNRNRSHIEVTAGSFADRYGIPRQTFNQWVIDYRGYSPNPHSVRRPQSEGFDPVSGSTDEDVSAPRVVGSQPDAATKGANGSVGADTLLEHHGQCSHCPDFPEGR
jgi:hypothetical protein